MKGKFSLVDQAEPGRRLQEEGSLLKSAGILLTLLEPTTGHQNHET